MKFLGNLKMKYKLLGSFGIIIIITVILALSNNFMMVKIQEQYHMMQNEINKEVQLLMQSSWDFATCRRDYLSVYALGPVSKESLDNNYENFVKNLDNALSSLRESVTVIENGKMFKDEEKTAKIQKVNDLISVLDVEYRESGKALYDAVSKKEMDLAYDIGMIATDTADAVNITYTGLINDKENAFDAVDDNVAFYRLVGLLLTLGCIILAAALSLIIADMIKKPIVNLSNLIEKVSKGDLSVSLSSNRRDEIGQLTNHVAAVTGTFSNLVRELNHVATEFKAGDYEVQVNENLFVGDYKDVAIAVNRTFDQATTDILDVVGAVKKYGEGDFDYTIRRFPGKKAMVHHALDEVQQNIQSVHTAIKKLISEAIHGHLDAHIDSNQYQGGWKEIIHGLNQLLKAVEDPIQEVALALEDVAKANFNCAIEKKYDGQFEFMKNSLNQTIAETNVYIEDIRRILIQMSEQDLDITIHQDYIGDFAVIKSALQQIVNVFNSIMHDFSQSAEQVAVSADQVSQASEELARGVVEQVSAIDDIKEVTETLNDLIIKNTANAKMANELTDVVKNKSNDGSVQLSNMLFAMEKIEQTSSNISEIISVISSIASQTNILALNASIEASRAGEKGKGFAVVAEEVKNLADKSKIAIAGTSDLIKSTLDSINLGSVMVRNTVTNLTEIMEHITSIAELNKEIYTFSEKQKVTISQIEKDMERIHNVATESSATSQQVASSAEELNYQSNNFKDNIASFNLRKS